MGIIPRTNTAASFPLNERPYEICVDRRTATIGIVGMTPATGTIMSTLLDIQMSQGKQLAMASKEPMSHLLHPKRW